ncbi:hypothetical protein D6C83_05600 [Aureobasidium pullulans]|uniref:Uncharacterized protein n=1 Tax=Aureobasidium pullulans TaxID=5580 RepID=A0A4T0CE00_AURPU|nr:hypothetical protein D6C83_05600 [Aureobasidium pullulans]
MSSSQTLIHLAQTQRALVAQFLASLAPNASTDTTAQLPPNPPNPLHVLRDSATLLKAHTTKLALLLINKPFTPTAVTSVLRDATQTCLPAMMSAVELCRPDLKERLQTTADKLKKIQFLYAAITKRRLKTFTADIASKKVNILTLDKLMHLLKDLPESVDDLANAFYELDADQVDTILASCVANACSAAELLKIDWNGKDDEFTAWVTKWTSVVK